MAEEKVEEKPEDIYIERIREPGWDELYQIDGLGYVDGTQTQIIGEIQNYREKEYFTETDQTAYTQLVELAEKKGYVGGETLEKWETFVPKNGVYKNDEDLRAYRLAEDYKVSGEELTKEQFSEILDKSARGDVKSLIEEAANDSYYSEDEVKMMSSMYNERYGQYDEDYYKETAQEMSDNYLLAQRKREAEEELGDFHLTALPLVQAIAYTVDIDSKISTANGYLSALETPKKTSIDGGWFWNHPALSGLWSKYELDIDDVISKVEELLNKVKTDSSEMTKASSDLNNDVFETSQKVAAAYPEFGQVLNDYFKTYAENMIKGLESGAISFNLGQFVDTIVKYLDGDVNGLDINVNQKRLLQTVIKNGLDQIDYENSSDFEKLLTECGVAVAGFAEGFVNKLEGVVDGGITVLGGVVAAPSYLMSMSSSAIGDVLEQMGYTDAANDFKADALMREQLADETISLVRDVVGYDVSGKFFDVVTSDMNQYAVEHSHTRKISNSLGGAAFDFLLGTYGGGAAVWINALSSTGKYSEDVAKIDGLSNKQYTSMIVEASIGNFVFASLGKDVKAMKCKTVEEYLDKSSRASALGVTKGMAQTLLDYQKEYASGETTSDFATYVVENDKVFDLMETAVEQNLITMAGAKGDKNIKLTGSSAAKAATGKVWEKANNCSKKINTWAGYANDLFGTDIPEIGVKEGLKAGGHALDDLFTMTANAEELDDSTRAAAGLPPAPSTLTAPLANPPTYSQGKNTGNVHMDGSVDLGKSGVATSYFENGGA